MSATPARGRGLVVATLVLAAFACREPPPEEVETINPVAVVTVLPHRGTLRALVEASGVVAAAPGAELVVVAPVAARIAELSHGEGERVRRGELLVRFEAPNVEADAAARRADVTRAQARLAAAGAELERLEGLFGRGVAARKEVEEARSEKADAEGELATARSALAAAGALAARNVVRAPFDGVVAARMHNPGDLVDAAASDPILRLVDAGRLEVQAAVPLGALGEVSPGQQARLSAAGWPASARGIVVGRPAAADPSTGAATVRLAIAGKVPATVGSPVQVAIETLEHRDVTIIPQAAVVQEGAQPFVYVVTADHHAHRRPLVAGIVADGEVEVRSGVADGEPVIVQGQNALPDDALVSPTQQGTSTDDSPAEAGSTPGSETAPR